MSKKEALEWKIKILSKLLFTAIAAALGLFATSATAFIQSKWWLLTLSIVGLAMLFIGVVMIAVGLSEKLRQLERLK